MRIITLSWMDYIFSFSPLPASAGHPAHQHLHFLSHLLAHPSLQAIQHICTHPDEVCPAGWKPGERTMHPDPLGAKEYFRASA